MISITLFKSKQVWIARFDDPEVIAVMGTCDVPTAFTDAASAGTVAEEIGRRNPGCTIIVGPFPRPELNAKEFIDQQRDEAW